MDTSDDDTGSVTSKKLIDLKKKRATFEGQLAALEEDEQILHAAYTGRIADLDLQIKVLLEARQQELAPHQLGLILAERQHELSQAQKILAEARSKHTAMLDAFDEKTEKIDKQYVEQAAVLEKARAAAASAFSLERESILKTGNAEISAAERKAERAQEAASSSQAAHAAKCGTDGTPSVNPADSACPASQKTAEEAFAKLSKESQRQLDVQAAQNHLLHQELATVREQLAAAVQPPQCGQPVLLPPVVLPQPSVPSEPAAQQACLTMCQSLRLLAQQEEVITVTWADLTRAHLPWQEFIQIVPLVIAAKSIDCACGTERAPDQEKPVPRRLLELLRAQLDIIVTQMSEAQREGESRAQWEAAASAWATSMIGQAKRIQERKRAPQEELTPETVAAAETSAMNTPLPKDTEAI
jgi:hypothetical protein